MLLCWILQSIDDVSWYDTYLKCQTVSLLYNGNWQWHNSFISHFGRSKVDDDAQLVNYFHCFIIFFSKKRKKEIHEAMTDTYSLKMRMDVMKMKVFFFFRSAPWDTQKKILSTRVIIKQKKKQIDVGCGSCKLIFEAIA